MSRKKIAWVGIAIAAFLMVFASVPFAQAWRGWRGSGGWGAGSAYQRMYDPRTVETISGKVESVEKFKPMKGMHSGIHLMVKTVKETISVHLGPEWYIARQDMKFAKGDAVQVTGSRLTFDGKPAIIAREVKKVKNGGTLVLRNEAGVPEWAGCRMK